MSGEEAWRYRLLHPVLCVQSAEISGDMAPGSRAYGRGSNPHRQWPGLGCAEHPLNIYINLRIYKPKSWVEFW